MRGDVHQPRVAAVSGGPGQQGEERPSEVECAEVVGAPMNLNAVRRVLRLPAREHAFQDAGVVDKYMQPTGEVFLGETRKRLDAAAIGKIESARSDAAAFRRRRPPRRPMIAPSRPGHDDKSRPPERPSGPASARLRSPTTPASPRSQRTSAPSRPPGVPSAPALNRRAVFDTAAGAGPTDLV